MSEPLYDFVTSTGTVVADTSTIVADVTATYQGLFGQDLIVTPDSPAGVLITAEAIAESAVLQNNAVVANQLNPSISAGTFLDCVGSLLGIQRNVASQTYVTAVTVTGTAGTVIPQGSLAATTAGDQFQTVTSVTIPSSNTTTVDFQSVAYGPIPCAEGALDIIVSNILGWETVSNSTQGAPGSATQSDVSFRAFRNNTLGYQGVGLPISATSALYNVPGVTSVWYQDNVSGSTQTINGVSMGSHSVYAVVNGGSELNVASTLLENKSDGAGWNGSTTVSIVEPASGQTYTVAFDYATPIGISIVVTSPNGNGTDITNAILNYVAGSVPNFPLVTGSAWSIGGEVSAFEIAAAISAQFPQYIITNVEISLTSSIDYATTPIQMTVQQIATTSAGQITVNA